jgi:hypothetical protein
MIIQLAVSHQCDATTIVAIVPGPDDVRTVVYTGTHLEGDSVGTIEIDTSAHTERIMRVYQSFVKTQEQHIKHLSEALQECRKGYDEARNTLQSERDANAMLTAEIERLETLAVVSADTVAKEMNE